VDSKELPPLRRSPRNKNPGSDTTTNSRSKKTQHDINTQPIKINSNTENKHNNAEVRDVGPYPSLTKDLQEIDNQNNSDSKSKNESTSEESYIDTTEQIGDSSTNNIIKIRDSLFARTDSIVIFLTQDEEPCDDGSHLLTKDNRVPTIKNATLGKARVIKQGCRYLIALIVKTKVSALLEEKILKEALRSLYKLF